MDGEVSTFANGSIRGVAALVAGVVKDNLYLDQCLIEWLTASHGDASLLPLGARRAAMAVLANDEGESNSNLKATKAPQRFSVVAAGVEEASKVSLQLTAYPSVWSVQFINSPY
jgi:hypothetical protein